MRKVARRTRVLLGCVHSPRDAWLVVRMAGWRVSVPLLKWILPLPRLARLMWATGRPQQRDLSREERIATLAAALAGPSGSRMFDNCLERSLVAYRFLSQAGAEPELVVGVSRDAPVRGHAWVRVDGAPLRDTVDEFEEMAAFGRAGTLIRNRAPGDVPATTPPLPGRWR